MPTVEVIRPLKVNAPGSSELKIRNLGTETVYYGDNSSVSATSNIGSLASGESLTISGPLPVWLVSKQAPSTEKQKPALVEFEEKQTGFSGAAPKIGEGEELTVYTPNPGYQQMSFVKGSAANPDTTYSPLIHVSRTLNIKESAFSGDGSPGEPGIYSVVKATAESEAQAIGIFGAGITDGNHVGSHSNTDAVGGYFVGRATETAENSRSGIGLFALGRRDSQTAATTGAEIVSHNETEKEGTVQTTGAADTKALWVHCTGKKNSGYGIQIGKTERSFLIGVGFNVGSVSAADIRTDSEAQFAVRIRGTHSKAGLSIRKGSGVLLLGSESEEAAEPTGMIESPFIRMNETGLNFNGGTPVALKAAGAETTAAIWARLKELGLCT